MSAPNVTSLILSVESVVSPLDNITLFGILFYGLWAFGYVLNHIIPDDDAGDENDHTDDRRRRCMPVNLNIDLFVAFALGTVAYVAGITHSEFDVIGWGHWLLMYFVNMLCFHHIGRAANFGRRRTMGIMLYATIPFITVLVAKIDHQVQESRLFILATTMLLLIPIKRTHATWYRDYDAYESGQRGGIAGGMARVIGLFLLWITQILLICTTDNHSDSSTKRIYQLGADVCLLFVATDGIWEHWE